MSSAGSSPSPRSRSARSSSTANSSLSPRQTSKPRTSGSTPGSCGPSTAAPRATNKYITATTSTTLPGPVDARPALARAGDVPLTERRARRPRADPHRRDQQRACASCRFHAASCTTSRTSSRAERLCCNVSKLTSGMRFRAACRRWPVPRRPSIRRMREQHRQMSQRSGPQHHLTVSRSRTATGAWRAAGSPAGVTM